MNTNSSIGYRVTPLGAGAVGDRTLRVVEAKADLVDLTSETTIYEGYYNGTDYEICRIDLCTDIITRTWATGDWANRATLLPSCVTTTTTVEPTTTTTTETTTTTTELPV